MQLVSVLQPHKLEVMAFVPSFNWWENLIYISTFGAVDVLYAFGHLLQP